MKGFIHKGKWKKHWWRQQNESNIFHRNNVFNYKEAQPKFTDFFQPFHQTYNKKSNTVPKLSPLEQLTSPHYDIQILTEDPSNKMQWDKYSKFFEKPFNLRKPVPVVKVDYETVKNISSVQSPTPHQLREQNIDTILKSLYGKDHIVVLNPRNCDLKKKKRYHLKPLDKLNHDDIDNLVDNILDIIDKDDKCPCEQNYGLLYQEPQKKVPCHCRRKPVNNNFFQNKMRKRSCDESYLFYLTNVKNNWQDILMRILPIGKNFLGFEKKDWFYSSSFFLYNFEYFISFYI